MTSFQTELNGNSSVSVAMLGARLHFALPIILADAGLLHTFYTDFYVGNKVWLRRLLDAVPDTTQPAALTQISHRRADAIPSDRVVSFDLLGLRYMVDRRRISTPDYLPALFARFNRRFARRVARRGLNGAEAIYCFNGAALEIFQHAQKSGIKCILEQSIAPRSFELALLDEEIARWPGWTRVQPNQTFHLQDPLLQREQAEWELADRIVCASDFVAEELRKLNVPDYKLSVVPYGVDVTYFRPLKRKSSARKLNVLFLGEVGLRKGVPYLLTALRALNRPASIAARLIGPSTVNSKRLLEYSPWSSAIGAVTRHHTLEMYQWADVLVLPSICEGSATVTYEAMACGLPIITTHNTGSLVRDGIDGFIVPIRDSEALQEKISLLCDSVDFRESMAAAAAQRANEISLEAYGHRVLAALNLQLRT